MCRSADRVSHPDLPDCGMWPGVRRAGLTPRQSPALTFPSASGAGPAAAACRLPGPTVARRSMSRQRWTSMPADRAADLARGPDALPATPSGRFSAPGRLQPAGRSQDHRGRAPPRSDAQFSSAPSCPPASGGPAPGQRGREARLAGISRTGDASDSPRASQLRSAFTISDRELGKAIRYGVYDLTAQPAWASVGADQDHCRAADDWTRSMVARPADASTRGTAVAHHRRRRGANGYR